MHEREHGPRGGDGERAGGRASGPAAAGDPRARALLRMQATAGNRATARWVARQAAGPVKVEGPSRSLRDGTVTEAAGAMAASAGGPALRTAPDEEGRTALMLSTLGIPPAAADQPKPVPDEATKKAADTASGLAMAGAQMASQGVIENLLRGGGPKTQ